MPTNKQPVSDICMRDLLYENSEMIKSILQMAFRLNEFLFCDMANCGETRAQEDNKPDSIMKEMLNQRDLMKQSIEILGNTLMKLGS